MFRIDLIVLFISAVQISSTLGFYSDDFAFPLEKSDDFSSCTFENGTVGRCVNDCPSSRYEYQLGINPTICRFERKALIVCCLTNTRPPVFRNPTRTDNIGQNRRKSAINCGNDFSEAIPFKNVEGEFHITVVGGLATEEGEFPHMVKQEKDFPMNINFTRFSFV